MTRPSRVGLAVWRALLLAAGLIVLVSAAAAQDRQVVQAPSGQDQPKVNAQAAALQDFQTRMKKYLATRTALAQELEPLATAADARELTARQASLAAAIKTARAKAKRGDLIPPLVAQLIASIVRDDFQQRNPTVQMGVFEEVPQTTGASLINKTYPANAALPTVPPLLLMNLPRLPDNLQYRFVGRDVVILDADAQVVIDYIPRVLPAH